MTDTHYCIQAEKINKIDDQVRKIDKDVNVQLAELNGKLNEVLSTLRLIHDQTKLTNGRVNKIENETVPNIYEAIHDTREKEIQPIKDWRNVITGVWILLSVLMAAGWYLFIEYVKRLLIK